MLFFRFPAAIKMARPGPEYSRSRGAVAARRPLPSGGKNTGAQRSESAAGLAIEEARHAVQPAIGDSREIGAVDKDRTSLGGKLPREADTVVMAVDLALAAEAITRVTL